jgi:lipopolysaccharide/colanic/teichoic acid biosynthesis glycosyltransferase
VTVLQVKEFEEPSVDYRVRIILPGAMGNPYLFLKRVADLFCSLFALIALFPLMLLIFAAVRFTSKGPAVYRQKRIGRRGKEFTIYKFRTMINGADNLEKCLSPEQLAFYQKNRKLELDPRITKIGGFLRRTSLDELPQLLNILKGDMSIVGPRPMLPDEIDQYGSAYSRYVTIKPGLTGLWQIVSRHKTVMAERAKIDMQYLENRSIYYDFSIIIKTVSVVLNRKGAR